MASARTSSVLEVRKLRKKLRQIENLERLERALTDEEWDKVEKKSQFRADLLELLATQAEDEKEVSFTASTVSSVGEDLSSSIEITGNEEEGGELDVSKGEVTVIEPEDVTSLEEIDVEEVEKEDDFVKVSVHTKKHKQEQELSSGDNAKIKTPEKSPELDTSPTKKRKVEKKSKETESSRVNKLIHKWRNCRYYVVKLKGHSDLVTSVSADSHLLASGSRDTTLKLWDLRSYSEIRNYGGHTGSVTSVQLLNKDLSSILFDRLERVPKEGEQIIISGSLDCSFKVWSTLSGEALQSVYVFSPLTQVAVHSSSGHIITATDGGKLELWDIQKKESVCSMSCFDSAITGIKEKDDKICVSSAEGMLKVYEVRDNNLVCLFASENLRPPAGRQYTTRHIRGMAVHGNNILYGDDGCNIKVVNWKKGEVHKLKNHAHDFGITDSLCIKDDIMVSSAYDLDYGIGSINIRVLPEEKYIATLDYEDAERIISLAHVVINQDQSAIISAGMDLLVWVLPSEEIDEDDMLQSKYNIRLMGQAQDSDEDSDTDFSASGDEEEDRRPNERRRLRLGDNKDNPSSWTWWCSIL